MIDKPKGVPSFRCVSVLRRLTGIKRIGFAGTLDPLASGLMILAVGRGATKLLGEFSKLDKVYDVEIELGKVSNSYDSDGNITCIKNLDELLIMKNMNKKSVQSLLEENFSGEREQVPPIFSAIHVEGKRAYDLARKNVEVKLKSRKVVFFSIEIISLELPFLTLRVHCGSGTYIRSLAHDLGQLLGCGGYVKELRRIKIGRLEVKNAVSLDSLVSFDIGKILIPKLEY